MNVNKVVLFLKNIIHSDEEKVQLGWIYSIAIISVLFNLLLIGYKCFPDTKEYIQAYDVILSGNLDWARTPVYPIFLGIIRTVVGHDLFYWGVVCVQSAIFVLSTRYFYKLVRLFTDRSDISFWISIFYSLVPGFIDWNNTILTESLAIAGTVFLFYFAVNGWQRNCVRALLQFTVCLCLLCMLRPSFIYLLPVCAILWFVSFFMKEKRKIAYYGLSGVAFVAVVVLCYSFCFQRIYGIFTPSAVGTVNQYCIARQRNLLEPDVVNNKELKLDLIRILQRTNTESIEPYFNEFKELSRKYTLSDIHKAVSTSINHNWRLYLTETIKIAQSAGNWKIFDSYVTKPIIRIKMNFLYLFVVVYALFLVIITCRTKKVPYLSLFIYMAGCANIVFILLGAQGEWTRLIAPSLPLFLIMLAQLLSTLQLKIKIKKNENFRLE